MPENDIISSNPGANTPPSVPADQQSPQQATPITQQDGSVQNPQAATVGSPTQQPTPQNQIVSNQPAFDPNANHPSVKRANLLYRSAQALAGGPRYQTTIDDQGNRIKTEVPVSGKSIGLAIALEAVTGGIAGLQAGRGKGVGAAGFAGFRQVQQQKQAAEDNQDQKAQVDFTNRASAFAANLRTRAMAQEVGMRDEQSHRDWISQHAPTVSYIRDNYPGSIVKDNVPESEITTPSFTERALKEGLVAIPSGYTPRFDAQGNHFSKDGTALHDDTFTVVNSRRIEIPPDLIAKAQAWNLPGFVNRMSQPVKTADGAELRIATITDFTNKVSSLEQEQKDLAGYYGYLAEKGVKGADGKPVAAPDLKQLVRQNPALIPYLTGAWANHFGESASAALKVMKDGSAKGTIENLYGGQQMLDKYDLLKDAEKKTTEKSAEAAVDIDKEKRLIPVKAAAAGAEARAREAATQPGGQSDGEIVNGMLDGTVDITKTASIRGNQRERYIALAKQKDPTFNMQTYGLRLKMNESYTSGKQGDQIQSFNTFMQHAADASDVTNEYRQTKSPLINKSLNWMAKNATGDPGYSKFVAAIEPVRKEFATFLEGGHALTESDKHAAATILSDDSSPAQIQSALKQMAHTGSIRLGSLDDRYRATFGHSYQALLYPDTVTAAQKLGLGDFAAKYSGGGGQTNTRSMQQSGPPTGATMKVPGSDGKLHWSDGKQDLGVAQ